MALSDASSFASLFPCELAVQTTSKRIADIKSARFQKNVLKRGQVPESSQRKQDKLPVSTYVIAFFVFVIIGSCKPPPSPLSTHATPGHTRQELLANVQGASCCVCLASSQPPAPTNTIARLASSQADPRFFAETLQCGPFRRKANGGGALS